MTEAIKKIAHIREIGERSFSFRTSAGHYFARYVGTNTWRVTAYTERDDAHCEMFNHWTADEISNGFTGNILGRAWTNIVLED